MGSPHAHLGSALLFSLAMAAFAACGGSAGSSGGTSHGGAGTTSHTSSSGAGNAAGTGGAGGTITLTTGSGGTGGSVQGLDVEPSALQTITVTAGQTTPTVTYDATLNGHPVNVGWGVDRRQRRHRPRRPLEHGGPHADGQRRAGWSPSRPASTA